VKRDRVRRRVMAALLAVGRYTIQGLSGMQFCVIVAPEFPEASTGQRDGWLSAAERRAWADLERRLRD
jgi:hypothetical protein